MDLQAFSPIGDTVGVAVTSATATEAMTDTGNNSSPNVMIFNSGPNTAFVNFGDSSVTATLTDADNDGDMPIPSGFMGTFDVPGLSTHIAAICASNETATLFVTRGQGN